jgi:hypothetical protein
MVIPWHVSRFSIHCRTTPNLLLDEISLLSFVFFYFKFYKINNQEEISKAMAYYNVNRHVPAGVHGKLFIYTPSVLSQVIPNLYVSIYTFGSTIDFVIL